MKLSFLSAALWNKVILFSFFLSFSLSSQILEERPAQIWLRPSSLGSADSLITGENHFIGNYPVLSLYDANLQTQLAQLARQNAGTLFLVLKNTPLLKEKRLFQAGPVKVYDTKVLIGGNEIALDTLADEAAMIRIRYQTRKAHRHQPPTVYIAEGVKIAEVIYYSHPLTIEQQRIVESYLALKYSINITQNDNPDLRDYISVFEDKAWNSRADLIYDQEVLALGRIDRINFYQSQTFTADTQTLGLGLSSHLQKGHMPQVAIEDGSLLVLSKMKLDEIQARNCRASALVYPWKIRLMQWKSEATHFFLNLDTVLDTTVQMHLTDGYKKYPVSVRSQSGYTQLALPIPASEIERPLYLAWETPPEDCDPYVQTEWLGCRTPDSLRNSLLIKLHTNALPARLTLINNRTQESLEAILDQPFYSLSGLKAGPYHIRITHAQQTLLDELSVVKACFTEDLALEDTSTWNLKSLPGSGPVTLSPDFMEAYLAEIQRAASMEPSSRGIVPYPNPGSRYKPVLFRFTDLAGIDFTIRIFDSKGQWLATQTFTPAAYSDNFSYHFKIEGSYFLHFESSGYSEIKQLRIKSNLH